MAPAFAATPFEAEATRFFRKLLKGQEITPWQLLTDKLKRYGAAHRVTMPSVHHTTERYANNHAEISCHRMRSENYRRLRARAFKDWNAATSA